MIDIDAFVWAYVAFACFVFGVPFIAWLISQVIIRIRRMTRKR